MLSRLIAWSLHNRLLILAATLALFIAGWNVLQHMSVDVFPEFAPPQVVIQTEAPGMAPVDVESLITYPLESAINGTPGVTDVRSKTSVGLSTITVVFDANSNVYLVRLGDTARNSVEAIRNLPVDAPGVNPDGKATIPLREVANIEVSDEPYSINREKVQRLIVLGFNVQERDLASVIKEAQSNIGQQVKLPPGYFIEYGGQFQSQQEANRTLLSLGALALVGALLLLFKVFGTFREAFLVLFNLPLAMIGGIVALYFAGANMSVAAVIGFITLFGIATRNGIILVTHYNQLRREGIPLHDVVVQGTMDRLVPVLMTAATAALGLFPLLWGSPVGKELEQPLAQVVLGGLFTSTFLNMVVVPTVYNRIEQWHEKRQRNFNPQPYVNGDYHE